MDLCDYGCGNNANYTMSSGKRCCSKHYNSCPANKAKNSKGLQKAHQEGRGWTFNDHHRNKSIETRKKEAVNRFLKDGSTMSNEAVKNRLLELGVEQKCSECGITDWRGNPIPLELDHINGNNKDNRVENLRLLCPNCHSLTDTWRGRNKNTGKVKVSDKEILTAYEKTANIRQTLIEVGLAPKGGNYARVKKLIERV